MDVLDAPWCGNCLDLEPEYNEVAATLAKEDPSFRLAKVDVIQETKLADRFEINSYPIGKYFLDGKPIADYKLIYKKADDITAWLKKKKAGVSAWDIESAEQIRELAAKHELIVVGFFLASIGYVMYM